jgi:hypothetical protein
MGPEAETVGSVPATLGPNWKGATSQMPIPERSLIIIGGGLTTAAVE